MTNRVEGTCPVASGFMILILYEVWSGTLLGRCYLEAGDCSIDQQNLWGNGTIFFNAF